MEHRPRNILLLVVDSLRYDRLLCCGSRRHTTPFLDSIANRGLEFDTAYAPGPWTVPVHGSIFSGQLPSHHGAHRKSKTFKQSANESLAGKISGLGYDTVGFSSNPWLSPEFDFDVGFDSYEYLTPELPFPEEEATPENEKANLSSVSGLREITKWAREGNTIKRLANGAWTRFFENAFVDATRINDAIINWVREHESERKFVFANYMDVHDPHYDTIWGNSINDRSSVVKPHSKILSSRYRYPLIKEPVYFQSEPSDVNRARRLYDKSLSEFDRDLSDLFDRLSKELELNETLTIILGDHGECLGEHGYWGHGTFLYEELLRVPLLMWYPNNNVVDRSNQESPVSLLSLYDFLKGMAADTTDKDDLASDLLSKEIPLFAECTGPRPNMAGQASSEGYTAVIDHGWKFVRNRETNETDLTKVDDFPGERIDREDAENRLEHLEEECWSGVNLNDECENVEISNNTKSRLSDLGYL